MGFWWDQCTTIFAAWVEEREHYLCGEFSSAILKSAGERSLLKVEGANMVFQIIHLITKRKKIYVNRRKGNSGTTQVN